MEGTRGGARLRCLAVASDGSGLLEGLHQAAPRPNRAGDAANHDGGGMIRERLRGSTLTEVSISDYGRLGGGLLQIQGRRRQGDKATACG
mgnify:CR=1 FL=1